MQAYICTACGTQYSPGEAPPQACRICVDERQFLPRAGQGWTTQSKLAIAHRNAFVEYEPGVIGIGTQPVFAIGQRALLLRTPHGNVLWDCVSLLDPATATIVNALGGVQAMAISHPHFYATMVEWGRTFGVPVLLHEDDREWINRPDDVIQPWSGETRVLLPGVTIIRGGGHFRGSSMLHWSGGADGRGILCSSDTMMVAANRRSVSFMYSVPNYLPLPARKVEAIVAALEPFAFERIYGVLFDSVIAEGGKSAVIASAQRYLSAIGAGADRHEAAE